MFKLVNADFERCPKEFPFAYYQGKMCCKTFESPVEFKFSYRKS